MTPDFPKCTIHTPISVGVAVLPQGHLDVLDLLGDGREHSLLQSVELVEAAPRSHLTQTHEDTTHGLKTEELTKEICGLHYQYDKQVHPWGKATDIHKIVESECSDVPGNRTSRHS